MFFLVRNETMQLLYRIFLPIILIFILDSLFLSKIEIIQSTRLYWFPITLVSIWGIFFFLSIKDTVKKQEKSEAPQSDKKLSKAQQLISLYSRGNASLKMGRYTTKQSKKQMRRNIAAKRFARDSHKSWEISLYLWENK